MLYGRFVCNSYNTLAFAVFAQVNKFYFKFNISSSVCQLHVGGRGKSGL